MPKFLDRRTILGQEGERLVDHIVSDMGFAWNPTAVDVGIDGDIEVADPTTGEAKNAIIRAQVKACREFENDTDDEFSFSCRKKDIDYWLSGNAPVILVVCKPSTGEAYWKALREYFSDPKTKVSCTVRFNKAKERFDRNCQSRLADLALPVEAGIYLSPVPEDETVFTNLLPVLQIPQRVYLSETECRTRADVHAKLFAGERKDFPPLIVKEKKLYCTEDPRTGLWTSFCSFIEDFSLDEAFPLDDAASRGYAFEFLYACLRKKMWQLGCVFNHDRECHFFRAPKRIRPGREVKKPAKSLKIWGKKSVFKAYPSKRNPKEIGFCKHWATEARLQRYEGKWYVEITPTYYFTRDGHQEHPFAAEFLKEIKRRERHQAVMRQLLAWSDWLSRQDLLVDSSLLQLGPVLKVTLPFKVDEENWEPPTGDKETDDGDDALVEPLLEMML